MNEGQGRQQTVRPRRPTSRQQPDAGSSYYVPAPPARRAPSRRSAAWPATLALLALALIIAAAATLFIVELWLSDRVMPGVYAWDVDLGGLTRPEAMEQLAAGFEYPADRYLTLRYGDQSWPVRPGDLGAQLDVAATVDAAMAVGHGGDLPGRLREQIAVLVSSRLIMPIFTFDSGSGAMFLSQIARQVNRPLRNATLVLGEDLSVEVVPGQAGREMNQEVTRQSLEQGIADMKGGDVQVVYWESEPLLTDLSAVQVQVQRYLSAPIVLSAPDLEPRTIEPQTLAQWLTLQPTTGADGQATLSAGLDRGQLRSLAQEIQEQVSYPPTDAQFRFDDAAGSLVTVVDSVPGRTLDVTTTVNLVEQAAGSDSRTVELPLVEVRPALASEDGPGLGIVELIGEGTTRFAGSSAARVQNIVVGAAQFDGVLVAPGETFSFNHYLGEVTAEKGYEESIIIWGNTTRADVGGGLCQVSSTAFRAAFWAGVPIVERWAHAFRVSYYEPPLGMDATIYSPQVDLKWENDTGHYVLIQTYVDRDNNSLTFRYYGTNPGRTVEIDGPYESNPVAHGPAIYRDDPTLAKGQTKQIEWAKDGLDVTVYRIVKENGQEVRRDTFFSRYRPWQAVYLVGTREEQ
ncbi:MAG: VanW family protein [Anaerolineae bacterium]